VSKSQQNKHSISFHVLVGRTVDWREIFYFLNKSAGECLSVCYETLRKWLQWVVSVKRHGMTKFGSNLTPVSLPRAEMRTNLDDTVSRYSTIQYLRLRISNIDSDFPGLSRKVSELQKDATLPQSIYCVLLGKCWGLYSPGTSILATNYDLFDKKPTELLNQCMRKLDGTWRLSYPQFRLWACSL
jgi:hypothetical protein